MELNYPTRVQRDDDRASLTTAFLPMHGKDRHIKQLVVVKTTWLYFNLSLSYVVDIASLFLTSVMALLFCPFFHLPGFVMYIYINSGNPTTVKPHEGSAITHFWLYAVPTSNVACSSIKTRQSGSDGMS